MYPRNNAAPPIIDLGEILLKADGAQQTSGASARVKIGTGSWGAAAGTLACDATSGIWTYAPTQEETDSTFFIVAAYKANCTSVSRTIITTASATAGKTVLSGETHTDAVIPTVTTTVTATNLTNAPTVGDFTATMKASITAAVPTTGAILTALGTGSWLTGIPWNSAWDPEVQSEVQDAIEANHLDHLLAADYDPASKPGVATALLNEIIGNDGGVSQFTANTLELAPSGSGGTEPALMVSTTIATLASQTSFTLTAGSADNDAYNRQLGVITDSVTSTQKARVLIEDYVGASKTVTLASAPAFTIAAGDSISIIAIGGDISSTQVLSAISSAIVASGISTTVTGMPSLLRVGDARTAANGGAIQVRLYDVDDETLLFGLGTNLFEDATITFSLRRAGTDSAEGTEDAVIPCTWVEDGDDGYVQIAYEADALDNCDAMDKLKEKDAHRWGIKFQWGDDDPVTPVYGTVSVLRKIVTTQ